MYALGSTLWAAVAGGGRPSYARARTRWSRCSPGSPPRPYPTSSGRPAGARRPAGEGAGQGSRRRPASAEELGTGLAYVLRSAGETVDGPAVLTPSTRVAGTAAAVEAGALISDASEQTRSRDAVVALPGTGLAAAAEADADLAEEEADPDRRRRRAAFLVAAVIFLLYGGLALAGVFNNSGGGAAAAAADSSTAAGSVQPVDSSALDLVADPLLTATDPALQRDARPLLHVGRAGGRPAGGQNTGQVDDTGPRHLDRRSLEREHVLAALLHSSSSAASSTPVTDLDAQHLELVLESASARRRERRRPARRSWSDVRPARFGSSSSGSRRAQAAR